MTIEVTITKTETVENATLVWADVKNGANFYTGSYLIDGEPSEEEAKAEIINRFK